LYASLPSSDTNTESFCNVAVVSSAQKLIFDQVFSADE
jgi:hypothetical protein